MQVGLIFQLLLLALLLFAVPVAVGDIFANVDKEKCGLPFRWISGQICLWAGFQIICVPFILRPRPAGFLTVIGAFGVYTIAMILFGLSVNIRRKQLIKNTGVAREHKMKAGTLLLWLLVLILLVLQLVLAGILAYEEGDDAFYIGVSAVTVTSNTMYERLPYVGLATGLDARHGLAPFPIWVAMLSKVSGMHVATVAQIVLPVVLITMAYAIFYLLGQKLFEKDSEKLPLFLLILEILVIFGGQSLYTSENFLLVRTAQGKAVLANIIIPFLFLLLFVLFGNLQQKEKTGVKYWLLVAMTMVAGCLCSTQGALLTCVLIGAAGLCGAVCYRRWKLLIPMAACCILPMGTAFLYLILD